MNNRDNDSLNAKPWALARAPKRILIIRLQAIGDVVLSYPMVQLLKDAYPDAEIDFLTRTTQVGITKNLSAINKVMAFTRSQRVWRQALAVVWLLPSLLTRQYDVVIDLQRSTISRKLRWLLFPKAWSEFERKTLLPAVQRYGRAIKATGLIDDFGHPWLQLKAPDAGCYLLKENGWDGISDIVLLNPAGSFKSRNWPTENYVAFAEQWRTIFPQTQFLVMGDGRIKAKADFLKDQLGDALINLQNKTTLAEAFSIMSKLNFMLSEDSGLYWMAWVQKVPSIAMYGSTPGALMNMGGDHAHFFTSSDLPCGDCYLADCKFGEIPPCLSRYTPAMMIEIAQKILNRTAEKQG
ncbi:MAG: glycosyltransferase family 9 protein [Bacteroidota bacterium]